MLTTLIAVAALGVAIYSAVLARSAQKWQKARDKERRTPDVRASVEVRSQSHGVGIGELYLGDGKTIGRGDKPIVRGQVSNWPGHFFLSYEFLDERGLMTDVPPAPQPADIAASRYESTMTLATRLDELSGGDLFAEGYATTHRIDRLWVLALNEAFDAGLCAADPHDTQGLWPTEPQPSIWDPNPLDETPA